MTRVCLVGADDVNLRYELLSRETSREALITYDLREPFHNTVGLETVSLGAAVSLLNDLNWYLIRFVADALVLEPSVSDNEWLSRDLATAVRDGEIEPEETDRFLKVYGLQRLEDDDPDTSGAEFPREGNADQQRGPNQQNEQGQSSESNQHNEQSRSSEPNQQDESPRALVEPMFVTRTGEEIPEYDLQPVEDTLVVRVTESEFGA